MIKYNNKIDNSNNRNIKNIKNNIIKIRVYFHKNKN